MADPITAEQVARAIEVARADEGGISDALGGWQWDKRAPDYVRVAWGKPSLPDFIAALTRWRDELVAAETPHKVARWDGESHWELSPAHTLSNMTVVTACDRAQAIAWGYTIEGGPETIDDTAPGRLRERRERADAAQAARMQRDAADYAAALSAAEAERPAKPDPLAYADSPAWDDWPMPKPVPALEMVDVPQPIVKRVSGVMVDGRDEDQYALWVRGESVIALTFVRNDSADSRESVSIALLRAMLEAIDAQQGGAS